MDDDRDSRCNIISLDSLRRRAKRHVNWTHVMTSAAQGNSELAYLLGPNGTKSLVISRDYGEITSVILDDSAVDETTILRIPTKHYMEFLEPYSKTLLISGLENEYNTLDIYLTSMNQPILGPLTSARAVLNMHTRGCSPSAAIQLAMEERTNLVQEQTARLARVDAQMQGT